MMITRMAFIRNLFELQCTLLPKMASIVGSLVGVLLLLSSGQTKQRRDG